MLSGGYECVLVKWLTETTVNKPDTLPRLSAPIVNITCSLDNQHYAVSYIDNGIFLTTIPINTGQNDFSLLNMYDNIRHFIPEEALE